MTYPAETLYEEVAYVAYHFNWSRSEIMDLEHAERLATCSRSTGSTIAASGAEAHVVAPS